MPSPFASILAIASPLSDADQTLAWADRLAGEFGAVVDAAFMREDMSADIHFTPMGVTVSETAIAELRKANQNAEAEAREKFETLRARAPGGRFRRFLPLLQGYGRAISEAARTADLVVMRAPGKDALRELRAQQLSMAVLDGGGLVFAPPADAAPDASLAHVAVAWDGSREAARAMREAVPFLRAARDVSLVTLEGGDSGERLVLEAECYLAAHGVSAEVHLRGREPGREARRLLDAVAETGASMMVMGAYGRAQWFESVFGGATEFATQNTPLPLLLAH